MDRRILGRTGVSVSELCLGAMMFGAWGNPDHDESIQIIHAALDAGINFIDTADVYAAGESEEIVGKALAGGRRNDVILATKFHGPMGDDRNQQGSSRRWIVAEVENSLRRLRTDWIDLYQVHRPRTDTDIEETLSALTDLVHQGKVRYIGSSTFPASQIVEAQWVARERNLQRLSPSSPRTRSLPGRSRPTFCRPSLGTGWASCPTARSPAAGFRVAGARTPARSPHHERAGCRSGLTSPPRTTSASSTPLSSLRSSPTRPASRCQLAIAFVLTHPAITAAIIGPRTMQQFESPLAAAEVTLDPAVLDRIDEIVAPGTTVNPVDNSFENPALSPATRRR